MAVELLGGLPHTQGLQAQLSHHKQLHNTRPGFTSWLSASLLSKSKSLNMEAILEKKLEL